MNKHPHPEKMSAATRSLRIEGLLTAIRLSIANPDQRNGDSERLIALVDMLEELVPDEVALARL